MWNELPDEMVGAGTVTVTMFKRDLDKYTNSKGLE